MQAFALTCNENLIEVRKAAFTAYRIVPVRDISKGLPFWIRRHALSLIALHVIYPTPCFVKEFGMLAKLIIMLFLVSGDTSSFPDKLKRREAAETNHGREDDWRVRTTT